MEWHWNDNRHWLASWDTETSGQSTSAGGVGKTTSELQSPTGYSGIYANWNVDLDGDGTGDDPWDFGTSSEYPVIDYVPSVPATPTPTPTATPTPTPTPTPMVTDREILEAFYRATDGDNWENKTNWLSNEPLGDWFGVTTDAQERVTVLDLWSNSLTSAPSDWATYRI